MPLELFWINAATKGQLGIMPRPRGGDWLDGEIQSLAEAGVKVVVSLLTADEVAELEDEECHHHFDNLGEDRSSWAPNSPLNSLALGQFAG
jgi:hypothetical protein